VAFASAGSRSGRRGEKEQQWAAIVLENEMLLKGYRG
jgi:hypothetical protein